MDRAPLETRIIELLAELGARPHEIAASLQASGVRGVRESTLACPIAMHLRKRLGRSVAVTPRAVDVPGPEPLSVALPAAHQQFIDEFDSGCYPDLVQP